MVGVGDILAGIGLIIGSILIYWWLVSEGDVDALDPFILTSMAVLFVGVLYIVLGGK